MSLVTPEIPETKRRASWHGMSLRERIGQTCQIHAGFMADWSDAEIRAYFARNPVGGVFVGGEVIGPAEDKLAELKRRIALFQEASAVPLTVAGDLENGAGGAVRGLTAFPNLMALGAIDDVEAAYDYGRWTATEAVALGFNWCLGPVADLSLNWLNPAVNLRAVGSDAAQVARLLEAVIRGMQEHGLSATAKHFPGDGTDFRDQHLCVAVNALDEEGWRRTFGAVFRRCIEAGVQAIMAGHIALPWADGRTNPSGTPIPATVSHAVLTGLLRDELGFDGVVVSDALTMAGFISWAERERRLIEAFNAGVDVMLWPGDYYFEVMERAISRGLISEDRLNTSVGRVLAMKARQQEKRLETPGADAALRGPAAGARVFGRQVGERSLTLLRNRGGVLPFNPGTVRRVCVLLATARGEERGLKVIEPLLARLRHRGCDVVVQVNGNCLDLLKREAAGEVFDALIVLFEQSIHALKNTMRPAADLGECMWMVQGLATMQPVIVSLGSPYLLNDMPWAETCINAYGSSPFSLEALDAALFGEIPFSGVCPVDAGGAWVLPAVALEGSALPSRP